MIKAYFVVFAVLAATLGLASGLLAIGAGETAAPAVALTVLAGICAALPASWFLASSRAIR